MSLDSGFKFVSWDIHFKKKGDCIKPDINNSSLMKHLGFEMQGLMNANEIWKVYKAYWTTEEKLVAIKIIPKFKAPPEYYERYLPNEIYALTLTQAHPLIVDLFAAYESPRAYYIVQEFPVMGTLLNYVNKRKFLSEPESRKYFKQLLEAVECCHKLKIAHRDIKLDNIYLDSAFKIRLCEFGFATTADDGQCFDDCGSILYSAPEIFDMKSHSAFLADIWSMGVCLYGMLCGKLPVNIPDVDVYIRAVKTPLKFTRLLSTRCRFILTNILSVDPGKRWTLDEIRNSDWMTQPMHLYKPEDYSTQISEILTTGVDGDKKPKDANDYRLARRAEVRARFVSSALRAVVAARSQVSVKKKLKKDNLAVIGLPVDDRRLQKKDLAAAIGHYHGKKVALHIHSTGMIKMPMNDIFKYTQEIQNQTKESELRLIKFSLSGQVARKSRQLGVKEILGVTTLEKNLRFKAAVLRIQRERLDRWRTVCKQMLACAATLKQQLERQTAGEAEVPTIASDKNLN